jgi:hypothetical protein
MSLPGLTEPPAYAIDDYVDIPVALEVERNVGGPGHVEDLFPR